MSTISSSVKFNENNGNFEILLQAPTALDSKKEFKFITNISEIKDDDNVYYLMTNENFNTLITNLSKKLVKKIEDKFILSELQFDNLVGKIEKIINNGFSTANSKQSCTDTLKSLLAYKNIAKKSQMMTERRNLLNYKFTNDYIYRYNYWVNRWKNHRRFAVSKGNDKKPICYGPRSKFKSGGGASNICSTSLGSDYTNGKYKNNTIYEHASFGLDNTSNKQEKGKGNFSDHKGTRIVNMGRKNVDLSDTTFSNMLTSYYKTDGGHYTSRCSKKSWANPGGNCYNFEKYVLGKDGYGNDTRNCNQTDGGKWKASESTGSSPFATPLCSLTSKARYKKASSDAYSDVSKNYDEYFVNGFIVRPVRNTYDVYEPRMETYNSVNIELNLNQTCCGVNMSNMDIKKMGNVNMDCSATQDVTKNTTVNTNTNTDANTNVNRPNNKDSSSNTTIIIVSVIGVVFFLALLFIIMM